MKTTINNLREAEKLVKLHEDRRLKVYDDGTGEPIGPGDTLKGHPSIGWGRALDTNGIDEIEAQQLFENDIRKVESRLLYQKFSFWPELSKWRKAVLVDMAYNMGIGGLLSFKKMLSALTVSDFDEAASQMENSLWFSQTGVRAQQDYCLMKFNRWFTEDEAAQYFSEVW